jgi:hypothetical protein
MKATAGDDLRREFQEFFMISSLPTMRLGLFITLALFTSFAIFNLIAFPNSPEQLYYDRFWVVSPVMLLSILVSYIKPLHRWLHPIYIMLNIMM